jgi:predicted GNAT family N-acyltransferase
MDEPFVIKKVYIYNILVLFKYLWIRFKLFILEDKRKIIQEFSEEDKRAEHYILFIGKKAAGIVRVIKENPDAIIGRFGLLKPYRGKGYGLKFLVQIIAEIKLDISISLISLLTEDKNKVFYEKAGFSLGGIAYMEGYPFSKMILYVK